MSNTAIAIRLLIIDYDYDDWACVPECVCVNLLYVRFIIRQNAHQITH